MKELKTSETFGFLMFPGGIKRENWPEVGQKLHYSCKKNLLML